jgi:ABC-type transport system substrate-binding protein
MKSFALLLAFLALCGCHSAREEAGSANLRIAHEEDVQSWDPAVAYDGASLDVLPGIFETLYQYDYLSEDYRLVPLLASDVPAISEDGKTVRIPIRSGIHFQSDRCFRLEPGKKRELTANDFVFALKRLALPSLSASGWWLLGERIEGLRELRTELENAPAQDRSALLEAAEVPGLKADGPYVLTLKLRRPFPQLRHLLAMTFTAPVAPEAARAYSEPDGSIPHPVGTGPFELKDWQRGSRVILERNLNHHSEFYPAEGSNEYRNRGWLSDSGKIMPFLDEVVFEIFKADGPAWQAFIQGKIDALRIPKDRLTGAITNQVNLTPELEAKGVRLSIESGPAFGYLVFNMRSGILARKKYLRQAISSAIDRTKWIELVSSSAARKMTALLPPGLLDRPANPALKFDYDPERSRALLKKAGYPGGRGLPELTLEMRGTDGFNQLLGEFFVRELAAVGGCLAASLRSQRGARAESLKLQGLRDESPLRTDGEHGTRPRTRKGHRGDGRSRPGGVSLGLRLLLLALHRFPAVGSQFPQQRHHPEQIQICEGESFVEGAVP